MKILEKIRSVSFVSEARLCHEIRGEQIGLTFSLLKKNGLRKYEILHRAFNCYHLNWVRSRNLSLLQDPNPSFICATSPGTELYLCYEPQNRTLSVLRAPKPNFICATCPETELYLCYVPRNRTLSVLRAPKPNFICATGPGTELYLCYVPRNRTLSVLRAPEPNFICATGTGTELYLCYQVRAPADLSDWISPNIKTLLFHFIAYILYRLKSRKTVTSAFNASLN
jgi:hypothetical protein